ncbi:MAG: ISKra4 family transposase, partial [Nostocaceae cyanobacterium]|nr:ISKra4 family transposase [Nostocaceae cyanobacterium]
MSAVVSYESAAAEVEYSTGIKISKSAQQRLIHRQDFDLPQSKSVVAELSVDGGNIRLRTPVGEPSVWRGYKAICLHEQNLVAASFQENTLLIDWVNEQDLAPIITCLGDGHDGVWNIIKEVATNDDRREILDW